MPKILVAVTAASALLFAGCGSDAAVPAAKLPAAIPAEAPEPDTDATAAPLKPPTLDFDTTPTATEPAPATEPVTEPAPEAPSTVPPEAPEQVADCQSAVVAAVSADESWLNPDSGAFDQWSDWDDEFEEWLAQPAQAAAAEEHAAAIGRRDLALFALFDVLEEVYDAIDDAGAAPVVRALHAVADKAQADVEAAGLMDYPPWPAGNEAAPLHQQLADNIDAACLAPAQ
ncbi:hypothetical protein [Candidatus Poriferisocius sp.]|uniref:hypothetical protein n=1 Tax=Candidatus Poriferisocius sp. TaxID=3101276 RepID=UPI003B026E8B